MSHGFIHDILFCISSDYIAKVTKQRVEGKAAISKTKI